MLYDDYVAYTMEYQNKYGPRTVVLMEVGSFFELYAVEDEAQNIQEGANLTDICALLNIQSTRKNKAVLQCSRTNPMMAGFPSHVLKKFMDLLVHDQYTVVLVEQVSSPPNPKRKVTQIVSPSTYMDTPQKADHRYLMCLYLSTGYDRLKASTFPCVSVAYVDVTTGATVLLDPILTDMATLISDTARVLTTHAPTELVVIADPDVTHLPNLSSFSSWIASLPLCVQNRMTTDLRPFHTLAYQLAILRKVYPDTGVLTPLEFLQLERHPTSVIALTYVIQFVYEHNEALIHTLRPPIFIQNQHHLLVTHTSLEQLNIVTKSSPSSIVQMLNTCETAMGKRLFRERLLTPSTDATVLRQRYQWIQAMLHDKRFLTTRTALHPIKDVERLFRRLQLQVLQPCEWVVLQESLQQCLVVVEERTEFDFSEWSQTDHAQLTAWLEEAERTWEVEAMRSCNVHQLEQTVYRVGVHPDLDAYTTRLTALHKTFQDVASRIRTMEDVKLERTAEKKEYQLLMTKKRYEALCDTYPRARSEFPAKPVSSSNTSTVRLSFSGMEEAQDQLHTMTAELKEKVIQQYQTDLIHYASYASLVERLSRTIATIDIAATAAKHAHTNRYTCPELDETDGDSYVVATQVRHPLIEHLHVDLPYVANNVHFSETNRGMLLYGINFSGKSSYMKSVGVNVILAQAGLFVAAETFRFRPYHHVFTRIPSGDNLFKGQSTFVVEMNEVRSILKQCTNRSLVIGDEVASGTETVSGIAIVAATILTLAQRKCSFLFATHLHEVALLEAVQREPSIGVYHMSIHYDAESALLCYDRILKTGLGSTMYGLEVCQSLDLPADFIHLANTIRQSYLQVSNEVVVAKVSSYSSRVHVDVCSVCGQPAAEIHHLKEQHTADADGYIGAMHKNSPHNLTALCSTCHDRIHHHQLKVDGYRQTSSGIKLLISIPDPKMVQLDKEKWQPQIHALRAQQKSYAAIAKELGLTLYKVNQYMK